MTMVLPQLTVRGSATEMGRQYGAHFRDLIHSFVSDREAAVETYLYEAGHSGTDALFAAGAACLDQLKTFDAEGHAEHMGIADGAEIDAVRLYTATNMTDVRDIITLPGDPIVLEDEGCTAALVPASMTQSGHSLQGQTWDLNPPDVKYVVALHRVPETGPETWTVTCAGCQTLMGMNEHGVTVGTTNLKNRGAQVGIPYLSVLHKALKQTSRDAASAVVETAPVAGSHSYWIGDADGAVEWERTPQTAFQRSTEEGALSRSNHCLFEENKETEDALAESTRPRFERMRTLLNASEQHTIDSLSTLFADRADGRLSINRYEADNSGATTNAVVALDPSQLDFLACRGRADQGGWTRLAFERGKVSVPA